MPRRRRRLMAALAASLACSPEPHPWDEASANRPVAPRLAVPEAGPPPAPEPDEPAAAGAHAGPGCADGLRGSGEPRHDVVRLGLVCGPSEGFARERDSIEGALAEGGAVVEVPLKLSAGRCHRIIAAAEPTITDLGVEVRSERDVALVTHEGRGELVVLPRGSAFCSEAPGEARIIFHARAGRGRFAAEIWSREAEAAASPGTSAKAPAIDGGKPGD